MAHVDIEVVTQALCALLFYLNLIFNKFEIYSFMNILDCCKKKVISDVCWNYIQAEMLNFMFSTFCGALFYEYIFLINRPRYLVLRCMKTFLLRTLIPASWTGMPLLLQKSDWNTDLDLKKNYLIVSLVWLG